MRYVEKGVRGKMKKKWRRMASCIKRKEDKHTLKGNDELYGDKSKAQTRLKVITKRRHIMQRELSR